MVIVVDDDLQVREALESLLKSAKFISRAFASAEDLLESGSLAEASCVITDVRMPGMQGLELQIRIKREYPKLPVIMITGNRDEQTRQRALSEGATVLLYKPLDPNDLFHALYAAISNSEEDM